MKKKKGWKYKVKNKGNCFGECDFGKKTITVNKKISKKAAKMKKGVYSKYGYPKKQTSVINTLVHETMHKNHPRMHEKTVVKKSARMVKKLSKKKKAKLYSKLK